MDTVSLEMFSSGGVGERLRFFGSACYKGFMEDRSRALLSAAQSASDGATRQTAIDLFAKAVENWESDSEVKEVLQKSSLWAQSLFPSDDSVGPEVALNFIFAGGAGEAQTAVEKVAFGKQFQPLEGDLDWDALTLMCDPEAECPAELKYARFEKAFKKWERQEGNTKKDKTKEFITKKRNNMTKHQHIEKPQKENGNHRL